VKKKSNKKDEEQFFAQASTTVIVSDQRKNDQKALDASLMKAIGEGSDLAAYLKTKFTLSKSDRPHEMKF